LADLLLRGGSVLDATGARRADVAVRGGMVSEVGEAASAGPGATVLDASGCIVAPGLVDIHAHLREPGGEQAETIETGARAAALGGYTAVVAMPNTDPPIDSAPVVRDVLELGEAAAVQVAVAGAITVGRRGERLAPMAEMASLGVRIFTDDGCGVQDAALMRRALEYASGLGVTVAEHCEDAALDGGGQMNEGEWSSRLGMPGSPAAAEELMAARDIALARLSRASLHLLHVSCAGTVSLLREARAAGQRVSAEVAPHHLCLTDSCLSGFDTCFKVKPPLRTPADVRAVREALLEGVIDAVATDHAPHTQESKEAPFDEAPHGVVGLETALGVVFSEVVRGDTGGVLETALGAMSWRPAAIAGLSGEQGGPVEPGRPANLCVLDPNERWVVEPQRLASRSRNTAFARRQLIGRARHTVFRGEPVVVDGEAQR
jgi:dihydroorotase